ncbi:MULTISPECIES: peptide ABC transporter substrate-binding protein [Brochothrix]|uniref:Peptide ABC transporter substrate-binding protein n=1 Tax=Brochothrix thermosphacta TaxID=2756 RepID=A0A1D2L0Z2_BROTH|nr:MULTISPECIES: peptide ABC transporter substrate-binding protein [Brochothrix]ANZ95501.1 peptide ABC transporter substrate-binding protein [Brochothrix thermosphacta]ANZ96226.1 peptide ABC transporter substrate-binding protein [Brochothrix thermosphacta]ATF25634.1 peptide ABC transporter substrate-binding protein [Brochothrix thermosphacta]ATH84978.1 peptide ABC transporter substrate-binding protein [Brochothrix thermosphacta]MBR5526551.1 peptide ABC transporter substrate-binding protein [Br
MKKLKVSAVMAIVLIVGLVLAACGGGNSSSDSKDSAKKDKEQTINLLESAQIATMDTVMSTDVVSGTAMDQVIEGLYSLGKDDKFELGVAAEEPTISKDNKTYTFKLRDDAKWSNGDDVTANDFVFAWRKAVNPDTGAQYAYMFDGVIENASDIMTKKKGVDTLGVKAVDDKTLEVQLERPITYIKSLFAFVTFKPQNEKFVKEQGKNYAKTSENLIYNGPFTLKDWDGNGDTWEYVKNDKYWGAKDVKLKNAKINVVKQPSTGINLYTKGEADAVNLSAEYAKQYAKDKNRISVPQASVFYLKFNQKRDGKETPLANEHARKAIAQAFNKEAYAKQILANGSVAADQQVPEGLAANPKTGEDFTKSAAAANKYLTYNVEAAQKEWKEAQKEIGDKVTIELLSDDTDNAKSSSQYMKDQLEKNLPGLTLSLKNVPFNNRVDLDSKSNFDMELSGWGADYQDPMTFLDLYVTGGSNANINYSNKEYDALINANKTTDAADPQKRWENFIKAQDILINQDAAIAPIYQRSLSILQNPAIKDMYRHNFGSDYSLKAAYIK